jgi:hypothetical protein
MATRVLFDRCLRLATLFRPSTPDRSPRLMAVLTTGLRRRGEARGLRRDASDLHPQHGGSSTIRTTFPFLKRHNCSHQDNQIINNHAIFQKICICIQTLIDQAKQQ